MTSDDALCECGHVGFDHLNGGEFDATHGATDCMAYVLAHSAGQNPIRGLCPCAKFREKNYSQKKAK